MGPRLDGNTQKLSSKSARLLMDSFPLEAATWVTRTLKSVLLLSEIETSGCVLIYLSPITFLFSKKQDIVVGDPESKMLKIKCRDFIGCHLISFFRNESKKLHFLALKVCLLNCKPLVVRTHTSLPVIGKN